MIGRLASVGEERAYLHHGRIGRVAEVEEEEEDIVTSIETTPLLCWRRRRRVARVDGISRSICISPSGIKRKMRIPSHR